MGTRILLPGAVTSYRDFSTVDQVTPPVVVGDPPQWADDSDATYAKFSGYKFTGSSAFGDGARSTLGPFPTLRVADKGRIVVRMKIEATHPLAVLPNVTLKLSEGTDTRAAYWGGDPAPQTPTWVTSDMQLEAGWTIGQILEQLRDFGMFIEVRAVFGADPGYDYALDWIIYELWFEVLQVGLHPCRQFPRADGLAASSAKRQYPPDKSLQASPRHAGVYW